MSLRPRDPFEGDRTACIPGVAPPLRDEDIPRGGPNSNRRSVSGHQVSVSFCTDVTPRSRAGFPELFGLSASMAHGVATPVSQCHRPQRLTLSREPGTLTSLAPRGHSLAPERKREAWTTEPKLRLICKVLEIGCRKKAIITKFRPNEAFRRQDVGGHSPLCSSVGFVSSALVHMAGPRRPELASCPASRLGSRSLSPALPRPALCVACQQ